MTAAEFLPLVRGSWTSRDAGMGHCPAHKDKSRSLSVRQSKNRLLLNCFAGCHVTAILRALGLGLKDLFSGAPLTAGQRASAEKARRAADAADECQRRAERSAFDTERCVGRLFQRIADELALLPDGDPQETALTRLYHEACELFRRCEAESETVLAGRRREGSQGWQPA